MLGLTQVLAAMDHDFNRAILEETAHRPWKMPDGPWLMTQTWHDLLFAHWPVDPDELHRRIPAEFTLDIFDGVTEGNVIRFAIPRVEPLHADLMWMHGRAA
mgnify:CR=1 FL=1